jgi:hypothetical protein
MHPALMNVMEAAVALLSLVAKPAALGERKK